MAKYKYKFNPETVTYDKISMSFRQSLMNIAPIIVILVSSLTTGYFLAEALFFNDKVSSKDKSYKLEFSESVDKYLKTKSKKNLKIDDFKILFNSIDRRYDGKLKQYGFVNLIEDYYSNRILKTNDTISKQVYDIIVEERSVEPFSLLPKEQKRLLTNLKRSIETSDSENSTFNLNELNHVLNILNSDLYEERESNRLSTPFAVIGITLTVFFGLLSLFLEYKNSRYRQIVLKDKGDKKSSK